MAQTPDPVLYELAQSADGQHFLPLYHQEVVMLPATLAVACIAVVWVLWANRGALGRWVRPVLLVALAFTLLATLGAVSKFLQVYSALAFYYGERGQIAMLTYLTTALHGGTAAAAVYVARLIWRQRPDTRPSAGSPQL